MKKISRAAIVLGLVPLILSGCTQSEEVNKETETVVIEATVDAVVEERVALEIDFSNKSYSDMIDFIEIHKNDATQEEKDEMLLQYDEQLRENFKTLMPKFNDMTYFKAINDTKDQQYVLHLDEIKDQKIKAETEELVTAGYGFQMLEGSYYLVIDYVKINKMFNDIMSENLSSYYTLRSEEAAMPVTVEEYLNISFDDVYYRVATLEGFIRNNPNFKFKEDAKNWLNWYINSLLSVDIFSGAVDYETGFVSEQLKLVYEQAMDSDLIVTKSAVSEMQALVKSYDCIIKPDNQEAMDAVHAIRNKYYQEVPTLVEEHYPAQ